MSHPSHLADLSSGKARYVTVCQQLLALAAVGSILLPAAGVVSLDVVHDPDPISTQQPVDHHSALPRSHSAAPRGR